MPRIVTILLVAAAASTSMVRVSPPLKPYIVGAYYYGWYDSKHWATFGHVGRHLPEPLEPALGEYDSEDPAVVRTHIQWASDYGIDFFILSWSGPDTTSDRQAREVLLPALARSDVRQAPIVEILRYRDLYGDLDLRDDAFHEHLRSDVRYVAEHYLRHPSALRVQGRPVLFLYLTRELKGEIGASIERMRQDLGAMGIDPFIVADEVFWQDVDETRLVSFDAITAYNVYDWPLTRHAGYAARSTFFADVDRLFARWRDAARAAGIAFVPNAMPGYNDRGVRLQEDHYVIPRALRPGGPYTGFFARSIQLAQRYVDETLRMVTITSFNEWHEWTAIEPSRHAVGREPAPDPSVYTEGFPHPRHRMKPLELVRDRFATRTH